MNELINKVEGVLHGTGFGWLLRQDGEGHYFANIANEFAEKTFPYYDTSPQGALRGSLWSFQAWRDSKKRALKEGYGG